MAKTGEGAASENLTAHYSRCFRSSQRRKCQAVENQNKRSNTNNAGSVEGEVTMLRLEDGWNNLHPPVGPLAV